MNFKTALSASGGLVFIYQSGKTRKTDFIEVSYYGDDYLLAKTEADNFYTLLDLDGNQVENDLKVVYRFYNGLLLTYTNLKKTIESSDELSYILNYNVYNIYNFDTGSVQVINAFHQEDYLQTLENKFSGRHNPVIIKEIFNKPIVQFKGFVFSEIIGERFILCCNLSLLKDAGSASFNNLESQRIWEVADIFYSDNQNSDTYATNATAGKTFKEAYRKLIQLTEVHNTLVNDSYLPNENIFYWGKNSWWKVKLSQLFVYKLSN